MLSHLVFDEVWCNWTKKSLDSGTSSILINGVPGKIFHCKRGVRQRDPFSPLLFVLVADLLQCIINNAHDQGLLSSPIPSAASEDFPVVQYVDDTVIFMKVSQQELFCLKGILESFSQSTG